MSQSEVERFVEDLKNNEELRNELSGHASGMETVVAFAKDKGYDISAEEAGAYITARAGKELSDEQLDALAGGKGGQSAPPGAVQTIVAATTTAAATTVGAAIVIATT